MTENTGKKQKPAHLFKPGQSGNPLGWPKGSRNKLSEDFIAAMAADFEEHGVTAITSVRAERSGDYLKIIASIVPKELHVKDASLDDMTDNELIELLAAVRPPCFRSPKKAGSRGKQKVGEEGPSPARRTH